MSVCRRNIRLFSVSSEKDLSTNLYALCGSGHLYSVPEPQQLNIRICGLSCTPQADSTSLLNRLCRHTCQYRGRRQRLQGLWWCGDQAGRTATQNRSREISRYSVELIIAVCLENTILRTSYRNKLWSVCLRADTESKHQSTIIGELQKFTGMHVSASKRTTQQPATVDAIIRRRGKAKCTKLLRGGISHKWLLDFE